MKKYLEKQLLFESKYYVSWLYRLQIADPFFVLEFIRTWKYFVGVSS
jgi:hypothetical protein